VLRGVAEVLRDALRDMDLVSRIGGEEFAVILPNTNSHDAKRVAERVRALVASSRFAFEKSALSVTVSVGLAMVDVGDDTLSMIKRADEALYASKRAGRNCGHFHTGQMCERIEMEIEPGQPGPTTLDEAARPSSGDEPAAPPKPTNAVPAASRGQPSAADDEAELDRICEDLRLRLAEVGERPSHV
jgi:diguanylate cyclase